MKHKHYEMIVAKAANMELVQFYRGYGEFIWREEPSRDDIPSDNELKYFLCLPQHKDTVIDSLNGGVAIFESPREKGEHALTQADWVKNEWYMQDDCNSRIKPKKEKRWIAVNPDGYVMPIHTDSIESARAHACHDTTRLTLGVQFIEIEVEVWKPTNQANT